MTLRTVARVQILVEVDGSPYGPEWRVGDICKQANEEAVNGLRNKLAPLGIRVIGEPRTTLVMVQEERK